MLSAYLSEDDLANAEIWTCKIINTTYITNTIASGNVYFGCAELYAYKGALGNKGQGDEDEGLYARVLRNNSMYLQEQQKIFGRDLVIIENGNFLDLKLRSVINMPLYCVYTINAKDSDVKYFDEPGETPNIFYRTYEFFVPKIVFQDFSTDDFGIIKFINHTDLYSRIENSLQKIGCKTIERNRIRYVARENMEWICPDDHPHELFYKGDNFSYQKEGRIIVSDNVASFVNEEKVTNKYKAINIGDLTDLVERSSIRICDVRAVISRVRIEEVEEV
jgi:hypothetical protein